MFCRSSLAELRAQTAPFSHGFLALKKLLRFSKFRIEDVRLGDSSLLANIKGSCAEKLHAHAGGGLQWYVLQEGARIMEVHR